MAKKGKRFVIREEQSLSWGSVQIVVDTATGVNYLDANGNVVVDSTAQYTLE